jgi:3'-5' exoribonuclease
LHLLITHHGKLEHGSPKLPMTPEALMLAYLDDLDSKVEAMQRLMADPHAVGEWTRISPMFERPVYRGRTMRKDEPRLSPADVSPTAAETAPQTTSPASPNRSASSAGGSFNTPFQDLGRLVKE